MAEKLLEGLIVMVVGMGGVFTALVFFYLLISLINYTDKVFKNISKPDSKQQSGSAIQNDSKTTSESEESFEELVAVITSAAYFALKKQVVVKSINFLHDSSESSWATIGRLNIIGSHNIQKK